MWPPVLWKWRSNWHPILPEAIERKITFPQKDDETILMYQLINSHITNTGVMEKDNVIKAFLLLFKAGCPPVLILHELLKGFCVTIAKVGSSAKNLMKIDLSKMLVLGTTKALKKFIVLQGPDVYNFRKEVHRIFRMKIIEKFKEYSPIKYSVPLYLCCFYHHFFKHSIQNLS